MNYQMGPLARGDAIGVRNLLIVLENLHAGYGEDRYRPSPLIRQRAFAGSSLHLAAVERGELL